MGTVKNLQYCTYKKDASELGCARFA
jgi:hypothetical protein